jgi:hypothetical protein
MISYMEGEGKWWGQMVANQRHLTTWREKNGEGEKSIARDAFYRGRRER